MTAVVEVNEVGGRGVAPARDSFEGVTPLMTACQRNNLNEVRSLLHRRPAMVLQRDRTGKTALHYCCENTSLACAEELLNVQPKLINMADDEGYTPLHLAIINGNVVLVRFLLSKNADIDVVDKEKHSGIHWATVCGELEALDLLLAAGANASTADMHGAFPIHYAAQMCGRNSEMGHDPAVGMAALRRLINHGVDVHVRDQDGRQPLLWAASAGSSDAMLSLVNAGADVTAKDKDGLTALHCAASRGNNECVEILLTLCGVDVDIRDNNGCTSLFYAVTLGHADCTALLLRFSANPNHQDNKGRTAAHCGAAKGQLETLKILEKHNADLWKQNNRGDLPVHEAVQSGRKELVLWLLDQRTEAPNYTNNEGRTCLHIAAINNNVELCKVLIDRKADVNPVMRNTKGQLMTPLDASLFRGNRGCANYLQLHGGMPASKLSERTDKSVFRTLASQGSQTTIEESRVLSPLPRSESKHESIQTEYLTNSQNEKSIQADISPSTDGESNQVAEESRAATPVPAAATHEGRSRRLEKIPEEEKDDAGRDERLPAGGVESVAKDISGTSSVLSEDNTSIALKDSGFSDNTHGRGRSDADDSEILSSPSANITFIDNGEVVRRRQPRRARNAAKDAHRGSRNDVPGEDSESELSGKETDVAAKEGGKSSHPNKGRRNAKTGKVSYAIFRPKTGEKAHSATTHPRNSRQYQKERRIFQELLELKRVQINASRSEENYIVRKLSDSYRHQGLTVANVRFSGPYTFHAYEKYLYDQLRQLAGNNIAEEGKSTKYKTIPYLTDGTMSDDPKNCTHRTYHCHHATHTYMGVPCVAYLKNNKPAVLPKITSKPTKSATSSNKGSKSKQKGGVTSVDSKDPVMLEIKHAGQVQKFSLPTGQLDKNKRYQLTFTIGPNDKPEGIPQNKLDGPQLKPLKNV